MGGELAELQRAHVMGCTPRVNSTSTRCASGRVDRGPACTIGRSLLESQNVRMIPGFGRLVGPYTVSQPISRRPRRRSKPTHPGSHRSRPAHPEWVGIDGERVLTTRQAYPPPDIPTI